SPRVSGQSFDELPFEEEILDFLWNTKAYKEYYACATGEATPKPKASARRKRSDSDTSITPLTVIPTPITIVTAAPRLTATTKGKQPAKAKSLSAPSETARTEAEQLKIVLRRSRQETHISQQEILEFLRFLGHSAQIKTLTDVNVNKLFQPWRSFAAVINKCLTGRSSGIDSLRLSQAQILWGLYHKSNVDYAFLIWEDFVYQVEHKNQKKSNEMYYPRFTKVIINYFMTKKPSIPKRNRVNWHYVRDDILFSTIKVVSRHQNTQQYGVILPIELTTDDIRNTKAYKEYYACATGEAAPKPKASARRKRDVDVQDKDRDDDEGKKNDESDDDVNAQDKDRNDDEGDQNDESDDGKEDDDDDDQDDAERDDDDDDDDDDEEEIAKINKPEDTKSGGGDDEETKSDEESAEEETREEKEESFNPIPRTPEDSEDDGNGEENQGLRVSEEQRLIEEEEADELYRDVNINQGLGLQVSQDIEDSHLTLTLVHPDGQQKSSSVSSFVTSMLNPISDTGVESIFTTASSSVAPLPTHIPTMTSSIIITITTQMHEAVRVAFQIQTDRLHDSYQRENDEFLKTIDDNMKRIIKEQVKCQVKDQVSRILPRIEQSVNAQLESEVLTMSSHSSRTSYAVAADLSEIELKKILIEKMEGNKPIQRSDEQRNLYKALVDAYEADKTILESYGETAILKRRREDDDDQEGPSARSDQGFKRQREGGEPESASTPSELATRSASRKPPTPDRDWNKTLVADQGSTQTWIRELVKHIDSRSSFNELLDTLIDFSKFIMNRLSVDTLTPELLAGPTYELMRGSCNSLTELEYHLEEVYKATTDQLDWVNPEGQQYPHNLLQPLLLIPDNRGRRVIPFAHFINNDLEYLRGGTSSKKYTTSLTKIKAADYGHIKWIEDLFYGFAVNRESALDVYSKRRIIAVIDLKIVEWHNYKHLDWISVRCDDDKIYKFKEGDFKRLRLQDIEDMPLLLVQGKLSNLTVEEHFAFNVSLRMFTRSIIIQQRVEDLQLRKGDKDRAVAMIQAIDKMLKTRRIMRSLERFVGGRLLTELEYHLEEVYKATTDQLDWVNPEGQQYPHDLMQPLPLIPDNRGRRVIPFEHFINNDLEYLRGGASSRKYTTSVTKTKAADYGHIKWIEDLVPRAMWIQEPINYDRHALWGVSHWGRKRQQFYGFAVNREFTLDVYSKRRIIAVTELKIMEWHDYKHLDWISVRRDDDKIYKFKEGDFKRLRLQDIKDMLLLLVQGKLSNLIVKERFAFNVSLRMFTRSTVIKRRVEDLQLGVKSYQEKLNLTKPDTYRTDLRRREAYTSYSNLRGFIYKNKDKKNRLMRIDELYKFSDGTLNDVRNTLDDRLKGIRMQYFPTTIWRRGDKDRAAAMIQAIEKMLKTRWIMRSLEKFIGG
nr:hypothetical protein [Tanacetum cinerariifolium]